jgi:hypothetical protein
MKITRTYKSKIPQSVIDQIRQATSLPDLVREYGVSLRPVPGGYLGLCPFHNEKTPSFRVNTTGEHAGLYCCFGCGQKGNCFMFLQEIEHISFRSAVEHLAVRARIQINEKPVSKIQHAAEVEDGQMYPWWLSYRQMIARRVLDDIMKDGPPENHEDFEFSECVGRLLRYVPDMNEFRCMVTSEERRLRKSYVREIKDLTDGIVAALAPAEARHAA